MPRLRQASGGRRLLLLKVSAKVEIIGFFCDQVGALVIWTQREERDWKRMGKSVLYFHFTSLYISLVRDSYPELNTQESSQPQLRIVEGRKGSWVQVWEWRMLKMRCGFYLQLCFSTSVVLARPDCSQPPNWAFPTLTSWIICKIKLCACTEITVQDQKASQGHFQLFNICHPDTKHSKQSTLTRSVYHVLLMMSLIILVCNNTVIFFLYYGNTVSLLLT